MTGKVEVKEDHTQYEPVLYRYRRAAGDIDPKKLSCTLKMQVSKLMSHKWASRSTDCVILMLKYYKVVTRVSYTALTYPITGSEP